MKAFRRCALLVLLAFLLVSCREGPDRADVVQIPLFFLVLGAPALTIALWFLVPKLQSLGLLAQIVAYVIYETGVSSVWKFRIDLSPLLLSFAINIVIVVIFHGDIEKSRSPGEGRQTRNPLPGHTVCDACRENFPSHFYLEGIDGRVGFYCKECR